MHFQIVNRSITADIVDVEDHHGSALQFAQTESEDPSSSSSEDEIKLCDRRMNRKRKEISNFDKSLTCRKIAKHTDSLKRCIDVIADCEAASSSQLSKCTMPLGSDIGSLLKTSDASLRVSISNSPMSITNVLQSIRDSGKSFTNSLYSPSSSSPQSANLPSSSLSLSKSPEISPLLAPFPKTRDNRFNKLTTIESRLNSTYSSIPSLSKDKLQSSYINASSSLVRTDRTSPMFNDKPCSSSTPVSSVTTSPSSSSLLKEKNEVR